MKAGFAKVLSGKECSGRNGRGGRASVGLEQSSAGSGVFIRAVRRGTFRLRGMRLDMYLKEIFLTAL